MEESLRATFVESLGGRPVTPEIEKLKEEAWWFENLYATGTRSVRGIEAVVTGFLPTPARSVVKLSLAQNNFFSIASLLADQGYFTEFIYGGESHFDNMRLFFTGNGFQSVIDQNDFDDPEFEGTWGVSDEDLFDRTDQRLQALHASGETLSHSRLDSRCGYSSPPDQDSRQSNRFAHDLALVDGDFRRAPHDRS